MRQDVLWIFEIKFALVYSIQKNVDKLINDNMNITILISFIHYYNLN